jgi:cohesin loading factor subunit SCC2
MRDLIYSWVGRSGKGKATKNSNEAEYRTIFDNLISDLLAVLYWPEWPAASLLLSIASKFMVCCVTWYGGIAHASPGF